MHSTLRCDSFRREIILEALEDRIVLDAAVDPTDVVVQDSATGGLDPADAEWTWEHGAWCYRDGSTPNGGGGPTPRSPRWELAVR
jgi:hypothetical protein